MGDTRLPRSKHPCYTDPVLCDLDSEWDDVVKCFFYLFFFNLNSSVIEASFLTHISHFSSDCGNPLSELWSYGHLHTKAQTLFVKKIMIIILSKSPSCAVVIRC